MLSAALTALALTYVFAEKYESSTSISYRVQEVTRFRAQQNEAMGSPAPQAPFKVIGATLQEVLKSDAILRDVVVALRLDEKPAARREGPWYRVWYEIAKDWAKEYSGYLWKLLKYGRIVDDDPTAAAIGELRANIKVVNRDSYIFVLQVRDRYPDRAARIVDHLGAVLADWLLEFDRQPGRSRADQLRVLLDSKAQELAKRRKEIESLLSENRVASLQQDTERQSEQLFALKLDLSRLDGEVSRARARLASVEAKLRLKQGILGNLNAAAIAASGTVSQPSAEPVEFIPPEDFKKLASERVYDDLELKSLLAKRDALKLSIDEIAARLQIFPGIQNRYDSLRLALASTERDFTLINDGYQEAAVRSTSPVSEVRVLHPALVPTNPATPIKVYHVLLAGGLGLMVSVGLVYMLDFLGVTLLFAPRPSGRVAAAPAHEAPHEALHEAPPAPPGDRDG